MHPAGGMPLSIYSVHNGIMSQGITFEKARRATNRSLKMTIWSLGSYLCYEEKISARGAIIILSTRARHFTTVCQGDAILTQPRDRSECLFISTEHNQLLRDLVNIKKIQKSKKSLDTIDPTHPPLSKKKSGKSQK